MGVKFNNESFHTHPLDKIPTDIVGMEFLSLFDMLFDLRDSKEPVFYYKPRYPNEYFHFFIGSSGLENAGIHYSAVQSNLH